MRLAWLVALAPLAAACGPDSGSSAGACKDSFVAGDLVITEVFADYAAPNGGTGTDDGKEWFEIYNNAERPVSLKGLTIVHSRPDGSKAKTHTMADVTVAPGQFFTLGNATQDLLPAYVDYGFSADLGDFYNTEGGMLALKCGSSEIDSAVYDMVKSGHSRQLTSQSPPDYTLNDDQANWCEASDTEFDTNNFGTPGGDNDCTPVIMGVCNDAGSSRALVAPQPGDLVITEALPNPTGTDGMQEWIEVKANASFDLNELGIGRVTDTTPDIIQSNDCIHVDAGTYFVIADSRDSAVNGGLPADSILATFNTTLGNTSGDIQITANGVVLDAISWTSAPDGKTIQLDPDFEDVAANDDPANYCVGTSAYGTGNLGSPGAANAQCASQAPAGQCDDGGTFRAIVKPAAGQLVITEILANPAGTMTGVDAAQEWFEIQNTGSTAFDLNELSISKSTSTPSVVQSAKCKSVPAGGYALFAHGSDPTLNGGLPDVDATFPSSLSLGNTSGNLTVSDGLTVLDTVSWTTAKGAPDGKSRQLQPGFTSALQNDDVTSATSYCDGLAAQVYGTAANVGTPKAANACQ